MPWATAGHFGESRAKTGEAKQPRLRNRPRDRRMRALGWARGRGWSMEVSPIARSEPGEPSRATLMGEGQTVLLGRRMKRLGERKGLPGERQLGEKGLEGEGGAQVPVYTARWGLGARRWPGCREGERPGVRAQLAPLRAAPCPLGPSLAGAQAPTGCPWGPGRGAPSPLGGWHSLAQASASPGRLRRTQLEAPPGLGAGGGGGGQAGVSPHPSTPPSTSSGSTRRASSCLPLSSVPPVLRRPADPFPESTGGGARSAGLCGPFQARHTATAPSCASHGHRNRAWAPGGGGGDWKHR